MSAEGQKGKGVGVGPAGGQTGARGAEAHSQQSKAAIQCLQYTLLALIQLATQVANTHTDCNHTKGSTSKHAEHDQRGGEERGGGGGTAGRVVSDASHKPWESP